MQYFARMNLLWEASNDVDKAGRMMMDKVNNFLLHHGILKFWVFLFSLFKEMLQLVKNPPLDDMNQGLVMKTIRLVLSYKASQPTGQKA